MRTIIKLACHHNVAYDPPPSMNDLVYCQRCRDYSRVTGGGREYVVYCATCKMRRCYGEDQRNAGRVKRRHLDRFADHPVKILYGGVVIDDSKEQTPHLPEYVEWQRLHPDHQNALRSLSNRDRRTA